MRTIYWDACVYLAWLMDEKSQGEDAIRAIEHVLRENFQRKNTIITSTLTFIEVLPSRIGAEKNEQFQRSFRTGHHIAYDVDPPIARKAAEIREKFIKREGGKNLATPDAIHVATALIYRADCIFTFDDGQKDRRHLGLLELDKNDRVDGVHICRPHIAEFGLLI
jgi:predicted nucleic acid-binding protein